MAARGKKYKTEKTAAPTFKLFMLDFWIENVLK